MEENIPTGSDPEMSAADRARLEAACREYGRAWNVDLEDEMDCMSRALAAADASAPPPVSLDREAVARAAREAAVWAHGQTDWLAIADAVLALLPAAPPPAGLRRVRHVKSGTAYTVLGEAEMQIYQSEMRFRKMRLLREGDKLVVYQGEDGRLWVRSPGEMWDGRFERLPEVKP